MIGWSSNHVTSVAKKHKHMVAWLPVSVGEFEPPVQADLQFFSLAKQETWNNKQIPAITDCLWKYVVKWELSMWIWDKILYTVILHIFGVVLFSVFSVVKDFTEIKTPKMRKTHWAIETASMDIEI